MKHNKTFKDIEASRNRRLWFTQVVLPTASLGIAAASIPAVREKLEDMVGAVKNGFDNNRSKLEGWFESSKEKRAERAELSAEERLLHKQLRSEIDAFMKEKNKDEAKKHADEAKKLANKIFEAKES